MLQNNTKEQINSVASNCARSSVKCWSPPCNNWVKFNSDAQFDLGSGKGYSGVVARNEKGVVIAGSTSSLFASSLLVAEALAIRAAAILASSLHCPCVVFESDSLNLIDACNEKRTIGEINVIVNDIHLIMANFTSCAFNWSNRNGNRAADCLAKLASSRDLPYEWISAPPLLLRSILQQDSIGISGYWG